MSSYLPAPMNARGPKPWVSIPARVRANPAKVFPPVHSGTGQGNFNGGWKGGDPESDSRLIGQLGTFVKSSIPTYLGAEIGAREGITQGEGELHRLGEPNVAPSEGGTLDHGAPIGPNVQTELFPDMERRPTAGHDLNPKVNKQTGRRKKQQGPSLFDTDL